MNTATVHQPEKAPGVRLAPRCALQPTLVGLQVSHAGGVAILPVSVPAAFALTSLNGGQRLAEPLKDQEALWLGLEQLAQLGALERVVADDSGPVLAIEPFGEHYRLRRPQYPVPETKARLSRFCYLRTDGDEMVLESPLSHSRARLFRPQVASVLSELSRKQPVQTILEKSSLLDREVLRTALAVLAAERFLDMDGEAGGPGTDDSLPLRQWEFHDLLFHSRSRFGRHSNPIGGTYRFRGDIPPLPAVKPRMSDAAIPLLRPDLQEVCARDLPVTAAIERRKSVRQYSAYPITREELGEFLFRTARVRSSAIVDGVELNSRPYPNGGASYELEIYLIANRCEGLLQGLFHYDPTGHRLEPVAPASEVTERFLSDAFAFCGRNTRPEILFLIAARFQRVSWKYASIAYATILKNVGALYQTMYLVATSMKLGPCALGSGDSDRFSELLDEDYYAETLVGEFMLGRPAGAPVVGLPGS